MKIYTIEYKLTMNGEVKWTMVPARSKEEAYDKVVWDQLGGVVYSAWVDGVRYKNGNYRVFNNFEGNPF